jgi:hypothetical protein
VKTNHSSFSKAVRLCALQGLTLWFAFFIVFEARADDYEECNQILTQDIFNKVIKSNTNDSTFAAEAMATFFKQSEEQAYDAYSKAVDEAEKRGTKIDAEGHYGIIGGEFGLDITSENKLSSEEFKKKFNKAKETYDRHTSNKSTSSQNLVNHYATYIRDPVTVKAWKDCITRTPEANLYAFASRDRAGRIFINVMWVPGVFAGSNPWIPISFVTGNEEEGITIHANKDEQVAIGPGRHYAVSCVKNCDDGFLVIVNGTIKDKAGNPTSDFTATVEVPPLKPPELPAGFLQESPSKAMGGQKEGGFGRAIGEGARGQSPSRPPQGYPPQGWGGGTGAQPDGHR